MKNFQIRRELHQGVYSLDSVAQGLEESTALVRLFNGEEVLRAFLSHTEVEVAPFRGYMWVNTDGGRIVVSRDYLREAEEVLLYLDLIHEIVHLRQLSQGMELFDEKYSYDQRPTELEAYRVTLEEARSLGLSDDFIREYLKVDWMTDGQHRRLLRALELPP